MCRQAWFCVHMILVATCLGNATSLGQFATRDRLVGFVADDAVSAAEIEPTLNRLFDEVGTMHCCIIGFDSTTTPNIDELIEKFKIKGCLVKRLQSPGAGCYQTMLIEWFGDAYKPRDATTARFFINGVFVGGGKEGVAEVFRRVDDCSTPFVLHKGMNHPPSVGPPDPTPLGVDDLVEAITRKGGWLMWASEQNGGVGDMGLNGGNVRNGTWLTHSRDSQLAIVRLSGRTPGITQGNLAEFMEARISKDGIGNLLVLENSEQELKFDASAIPSLSKPFHHVTQLVDPRTITSDVLLVEWTGITELPWNVDKMRFFVNGNYVGCQAEGLAKVKSIIRDADDPIVVLRPMPSLTEGTILPEIDVLELVDSPDGRIIVLDAFTLQPVKKD